MHRGGIDRRAVVLSAHEDANSTTLYVADEGTGDATDQADHAGLEKWSLTDGTWSLDYTLQDNLIGSTYNVPGWDYEETTSGLRDLTGRVNADGTVTLWAVTATTSDSTDNGADPTQRSVFVFVFMALANRCPAETATCFQVSSSRAPGQ
jgi:hypothetical protein